MKPFYKKITPFFFSFNFIKIIILFFFALYFSAFSMNHKQSENQVIEFDVLLRDKNSYKTIVKKTEMINLISRHSFHGKYFKIVEDKSDEAISFQHKSKVLIQKAATVYYHLNKSREFWINDMKSSFALHHPTITVRLEIKNKFNDLGQFSHDSLSPQYNNALSIPAGQGPDWLPKDERRVWGNEIWFRPKKMVPMIIPSEQNPLTQMLSSLKKPLMNFSLNKFIIDVMTNLKDKKNISQMSRNSFLNFVSLYALIEFSLLASKKSDFLFIDKTFYLDAAFIPEIIYHEYAHIVLSDYLELSHSTPVNEGMADYFAAVQSKLRKVYQSIKGFSNAAAKDTQASKPYHHWDESNENATSDFTLSVLWNIRHILGERESDILVYHARKYLRTKSAHINDHLLRALLQSCQDKCQNPFRDKLKMYESFSEKGF